MKKNRLKIDYYGKAFEYYELHKNELYLLYPDKWLILSYILKFELTCEIKGPFNTEEEAENKATNLYRIGTYIIVKTGN
ncbi:MAG: hypothetical protein U0W24_07140 [Bacteroidales bacterium]